MPYYVIIPAVIAAVGFLGSRFTSRGLGPWYVALKKPSWTPPGIVISAAWLTIYVLTGVSAMLVWQRVPDRDALFAVGALFLANAVLNVAWCYVFFARRRIRASIAVIGALEASNVALIAVLWRPANLSALLLLPYAAWTAFAAFLNLDIARRNRG